MTDDKERCNIKLAARATLIVFALTTTVGVLGCTQEPIGDDAAAVQTMQELTETTLQTPAATESTSPSFELDQGLLETAGDLFQKARSGTGSTAIDAKDWVQKKIGDAATASGESAGDALSWANETFESLKESGLTSADNTSQWLSQDWKNMQSWEYKTVTLGNTEAGSAEEQLNRLGAQGWECFHVQSDRFYFKKPADSYLRHLPFRDVIKLVPLLNQGK